MMMELLLVGLVGVGVGAFTAWIDLCSELNGLRRENAQLRALLGGMK